MADIPEVTSSDPHEMLSVGRRHLAVRDYSSAVGCLGQACELLAQKYGQHADECGEAYLWYGKSLLGLAREESGVLGDGIPQGGDESQDDKDEDNDAVDEDNNEETEENGEDDETKTDLEDAKEDKMDVEKPITEDVVTSTDEGKDKTSVPAAASTSEQPSSSEPGAEEPTTSAAAASSDSEEEEEVENLQVAWEVLELARDVFLKRGERGRRELADVYLHLGEVSLESETYDKAVSDMGKSLDLFKELYSSDDRRIAETHYQIGLAHSLSNGFEDAISHFKTAAEILEARIKNLESPTAVEDANVKKYLASDPFYSIEGEVKELKELLPEIQEKIQDMIDYKAEAIKSVRESLGLSANSQSSTNGQSSSSKANSSGCSKSNTEEKKASDISHLVRRKRKPSEEGTDISSPAKKSTL